MKFISLFVITMSGVITLLGLNSPTIDIDCKNKEIYKQFLNYCTTGNIPPGFPKEFIGKPCEKHTIELLQTQVNTCK